MPDSPRAECPRWIRPARPDDVPHLVRMIRGLAAHEGRPELAVCTESAIAAALFGVPARAEAVILLDDSRAPDTGHGTPSRLGDAIVGYAWFYLLVPTFLGQPILYLEDLFIDPAARAQGRGSRFMSWLASEALRRGCVGVEWTVREDNTRAIAFYESLGATRKTGALSYRLMAAALEHAARRSNAAAASCGREPSRAQEPRG